VALKDILYFLAELYVIVLIVRALMSWFPVHPGSALYGVVRLLDRVTEPVLRPIRRILPPIRAGGMAIDLSIIVAILVIEFVVVRLIAAI
jgi:YggT family protein